MKPEDACKDRTLTLSEPWIKAQPRRQSVNLSPLGHVLYNLDDRAFLRLSALGPSQESLRTSLCVLGSSANTWWLLQIRGETVCQRTGSCSGYSVLTDGQQTHQVPVRVHQEAPLENQSHAIFTMSELSDSLLTEIFFNRTYVTGTNYKWQLNYATDFYNKQT